MRHAIVEADSRLDSDRMATNSSTAADDFGRQLSRGPRLSDRVADLMLETIFERNLSPGDPLPSERELSEQYGVSRTVIREAVRFLVAKGAVDVLSGRGLSVAAVEAEAVSNSISLYLRGNHRNIPYRLIHELRSTIEPEVAGLAAARATPDGIQRLRADHQRMRDSMGDVEAAAQADVDFHLTLARMSQNELFVIVLNSVGTIMVEIRRAKLSLPVTHGNGIREHNQILSAVAKGDAEGARTAMRRHLEASNRLWERLLKQGVRVSTD